MSQFDSTHVVEIKADHINTSKIENIRTCFDEESIRELSDSIYRDGLIHPITVTETEDDDGNAIFALVAGEKRLRAVQYIQNVIDADFMPNGVPCIVFTGTLADAQFVNAIENLDREDVDDVDVSKWCYSRSQEGVGQLDLSKKLHKSASWVSMHIVFHERATEDLKEAVRDGLVSFTAAFLLAKGLDEEEQNKRVKRIRNFNEKITVEEARTVSDKDRVVRPTLKQRTAMLAKAEGIADEKGSEQARGVAMSLRWVDGLIAEEELLTILGWEDQKV